MNVWDCALGFMDAQVLLTAEELGVFDTLDGDPCSVEQVAAAVGMPVDSAQRLLSALCALGLVQRRADGGYVNGPDAHRQLVSRSPEYIGHMFRHVRDDLYPVWGHFKEALMEGHSQWHRAFEHRPSPTTDMFQTPSSGALREFMRGMHRITYDAAVEFAHDAPQLAHVGSILDIGGASGAFVIALAERFPHLRGGVFDLPPVQPITEEYFQRASLDGRMSFHAGNFFCDPIPAGWDAYALGFILHDWDTERGSHLLNQIAQVSKPGSILIVGEFLLEDDRTGPLFAVRQDLNMLVAACGRERTAREYADWFGEYGFTLERVQRTWSGKNFMIARMRAGAA